MKGRARKCNLPIGVGAMSDKSFSIEVFAKIQIESNWNDIDRHRYIKIDSINLTKWSIDLGISRKSIKKHIEHLESIRYLTKCTSNDIEYYRIKNSFDRFCLLDMDFIDKMLGLNIKNLMKVYLLYYKYSRVFGACLLEQGRILSEIGLKGSSGKNKEMLRKINSVLEEEGLIRVIKKCKRLNNKTVTVLEIIAPVYNQCEFYK